jgi:ABC-type xylose transport system permease subunit
VPIFANQIVSGAIVILAVAIDRVIRARAGQVRD